MGLDQIVLKFANFVTGATGGQLVLLSLAIAGIWMALHGHANRIWAALFGGALFYTCNWIITYFYGGSAAGGAIGI